MNTSQKKKYINNYVDSLNKLNDQAAIQLQEALNKIDLENIDGVRSAIKIIMDAICSTYTSASATVASEFYSGLRFLETNETYESISESTYNKYKTDVAVDGICANARSTKELCSLLRNRAEYEIKKSAGECVKANVKNDKRKPKYARVSTSGCACKFCKMLESRGAVYYSEKTAGGDRHYHAHCQCAVVPEWD